MRRLFYKIFLWFWLGMVLVSATLIASTALTHSRSAEDERWRQRYAPILELRAQRTAELYDRDGASALEKYLSSPERERRDSVRDYLFDEAGREVLGRQAPDRVLRVLAEARQSPGGQPRFFTQERVAAELTAGPSGRPYLFVTAFPPRAMVPRSLSRFLFADLDREGIMRLVAVLLVAGIFCFWLARHIASPIGKLRLATREIANEHLGVRVDGHVLNRRDELAELARDFNRMAERIEALITAQRNLLADVSHELRSPLSRLNLALGLARRRAAPEAVEHLNRIERETDRLNTLIGQLLALARVDSGVDLQRKEVFDLGTLLQEVAADGDYEARDRNCTVTFHSALECQVEGAREMLRGAIENVVRNAVRYTAEGTNVEITLVSRRSQSGPRALIQVRDHGAGVPEDALAELFQPFHRVPDAAQQRSDSAGLGLAITQRTFRLHGGNVTAANAPDGGLVITLELPVNRTGTEVV
ncbi:MAG: HAMP domain-containing protein [Acidobacteriia bacterium]|nr:HAMP domain-containing protein [Terriglobia bacterium]